MIDASPPTLEQFDFLDAVQAHTPGESRLLMYIPAAPVVGLAHPAPTWNTPPARSSP